MVELILEPTIEMTFLGLGSIKLLSCILFDYEASVMGNERFEVEYWGERSECVRQNPTIHSWGSISICICCLLLSLSINSNWSWVPVTLVFIYHKRQSFWFVYPSFLSSVNIFLKLIGLVCLYSVFVLNNILPGMRFIYIVWQNFVLSFEFDDSSSAIRFNEVFLRSKFSSSRLERIFLKSVLLRE